MTYYKYLKIGLSVLLLCVLLVGFSGDFSIFSIFNNKNLVAKVDDIKITKDDFQSIVESEINAMQMNGEIKPEEKIELQKDVLKNLVNEKLLMKFAEDLKIHISDDAMIDEIKKSPVFSNPDTGLFDKKRFSDMLIQMGKSEDEYLKEMKKSLALYSVFYVLNARENMPIKMRDEIVLNSLNKVRIIDEISIDSNKITFDKNANDGEIEKYYKEHDDDFKTSEYRKLNYIIINDKNFIDKVKIEQSDLNKKTEEIFNAMENKEIRDFYNVICDEENHAKNLKQELVEAKNRIEFLKNENNLKKEESCRVSFLKEKKITDLPEEYRDFVFSLKKDEMSHVKKTTFGYSFVFIENIKNIDIKSLLPEITEKIKNENAYRMMQKEIENIKSDLIKNQNLKIQDIEKKYNLKMKEFEYFDDDGYYKNNLKKSINDDYAISRDTFNKIYKSDKDKIGIEENRGDYFIYSVSDILQAEKRDIESVKDDIVEILASNFKEKKSLEILNDAFNDLEKNNLSLFDIEKKYGEFILVSKDQRIQHPEIVKSMESSPNVTFASEVIFSMNDMSKKYIKIDNKIVILKNFEKNKMNEVERSQYLDIIERNMLFIENKEMMESIFNYLRGKYKVKIYEKGLIN